MDATKARKMVLSVKLNLKCTPTFLLLWQVGTITATRCYVGFSVEEAPSAVMPIECADFYTSLEQGLASSGKSVAEYCDAAFDEFAASEKALCGIAGAAIGPLDGGSPSSGHLHLCSLPACLSGSIDGSDAWLYETAVSFVPPQLTKFDVGITINDISVPSFELHGGISYCEHELCNSLSFSDEVNGGEEQGGDSVTPDDDEDNFLTRSATTIATVLIIAGIVTNVAPVLISVIGNWGTISTNPWLIGEKSSMSIQVTNATSVSGGKVCTGESTVAESGKEAIRRALTTSVEGNTSQSFPENPLVEGEILENGVGIENPVDQLFEGEAEISGDSDFRLPYSKFSIFLELIGHGQFINMFGLVKFEGATGLLNTFADNVAWTNFNVNFGYGDGAEVEQKCDWAVCDYAYRLGIDPDDLLYYTITAIAVVLGCIIGIYVLCVAVARFATAHWKSFERFIRRKMRWAIHQLFLLTPYSIAVMSGFSLGYISAFSFELGLLILSVLSLVAGIVGFLLYGIHSLKRYEADLVDIEHPQHRFKRVAQIYGPFYELYKYSDRYFFIVGISSAACAGIFIGLSSISPLVQLMLVATIYSTKIFLLLWREPYRFKFQYQVIMASTVGKLLVVVLSFTIAVDLNMGMTDSGKEGVTYAIVILNLIILLMLASAPLYRAWNQYQSLQKLKRVQESHNTLDEEKCKLQEEGISMADECLAEKPRKTCPKSQVGVYDVIGDLSLELGSPSEAVRMEGGEIEERNRFNPAENGQDAGEVSYEPWKSPTGAAAG